MLEDCGVVDVKGFIYGCDIDVVVFDYFFDVLGGLVDFIRFVQGDFLEVEWLEGWLDLFDVVIGNFFYILY